MAALKEVNGKRAKKTSVVRKKVNEYEHELKIKINSLVKEAQQHGIPCLMLYYSDTEGYVYNGVIPEEIENPDSGVVSQYGKFFDFMRLCMNYNREEFLGSKLIKTYGSDDAVENAEAVEDALPDGGNNTDASPAD